MAIGTETNGSIVCPASVNDVVGFKPTHGLVSADGIVPLAHSQDTAGPIALTVVDAARALAVMIEPNLPNMNHNKNYTREKQAERLAHLVTRENLLGIKIGVLTNSLGFDQRRDKILFNIPVAFKTWVLGCVNFCSW